MEYVSHVPAPPLNRFIDDIYCLTGVPSQRRMNVPPMPSAHLGPVRLWDSDPSVPPAVCPDGWFMGVWTRRYFFEYPTRVHVVG
ncbi:MAG: AraC family transcriptional regulator, partial [Candidatus Dormiibacterota bacterium]